MSKTVDLWGATYSNVPALIVPSGNGTARFDDASVTTAVASDVAQGKIFLAADGTITEGTASGGGTPVISVVDTTDTHGGTIRTITAIDISDTTAVASDVASGKYFYTSQGVKTAGTASGGGSGNTFTVTTIIPEQNFTPGNNGWATLSNMTAGLVDGAQYVITYDGNEYLSYCDEVWTNNHTIGSPQAFLGSSDSQYPCGIIWENGLTCTIAIRTTGQHSVKVERIVLSRG